MRQSINQPIELPLITLVDNQDVHVYVQLQKMHIDFYAREMQMQCEVYTHLKASNTEEVAKRTFNVSNHSYRASVENAQGDPIVLDFPANEALGLPASSENMTIGNFDYLYLIYFVQFQLKAQAEAAILSEFTKTSNPLPPFVMP